MIENSEHSRWEIAFGTQMQRTLRFQKWPDTDLWGRATIWGFSYATRCRIFLLALWWCDRTTEALQWTLYISTCQGVWELSTCRQISAEHIYANACQKTMSIDHLRSQLRYTLTHPTLRLRYRSSWCWFKRVWREFTAEGWPQRERERQDERKATKIHLHIFPPE